MLLIILLPCLSLLLTLLLRAVYLLFLPIPPRSSTSNTKYTNCKTLIVLGSGGHTTEMFRLLEKLDKNYYSPRIYVLSQTDSSSSGKMESFEALIKNKKEQRQEEEQ
eukprot:Pgem_evm1s15458